MKKTILIIMISGIFNTLSHSQIIFTVAGDSAWGFTGNGGPATEAELSPEAVAVDSKGNIYIADGENNHIRKVNTSGIISTFAGNGYGATSSGGYSGDGGQATSAELWLPDGVAVDKKGNVYIADQTNCRIRKVNTSGIISTFAGNGTFSFSGDGGPATAAELAYPAGITVDSSGSVYFADRDNVRIRLVNTSGIISTVAGNGFFPGGYSGDSGPATSAELWGPFGVALDASGNIYIADAFNNRIRMVNSSGIINTFAGNGYGDYSGDGGQATDAEINNPYDVALDATGNIIIADVMNNRVRNIGTSGIINSFAGNGVQGFSGDGGAAVNAELSGPNGLAVDASKNIYISDAGNNRIRKIAVNSGINEISSDKGVKVYPNPTTGEINVKLSGNGYTSLKLFDVFGREVYTRLIDSKQSDLLLEINAGNLTSGVYFMQLVNEGGNISKRVVIEK